MSRGWSITLVIVAAFLLLTTSVGFWIRTTVADEDSFVEVTSRTLTAENVRISIAEAIVDAALADRPIAANFVRGPASEIIAGILGAEFLENILGRVARLIYELLVFNNGDRIAINLERIKSFVANILNVLAPEGEATIDPDRIPSEIVLVEEGELPAIQNYIIGTEWVTVILGLAGMGLLSLVIWKSWSTLARNSYLKWFGGSLAIGAAILGLLTWTVGSTVVLAVESQSGRVVVSETYENLVAQLRVQSFGLVIIGIGIWLLGWWMLRERVGDRSVVIEPSPQPVTPAAEGVSST
jgi:hypothetical protein